MTKPGTGRSNRVRLTKKAVQEYIGRHTPGSRARLWDAELPELYLMITPAGSASYCIRYQRPSGVKADYTIGKERNISPEMARDAARQQLALLTVSNRDPVAARRAARKTAARQRVMTLSAVGAEFMEKAEMRPSSRGTRRSALKHLIRVLGSRPIEEITQKEIKAALKRIQADIVRNRKQNRKFQNGHRMANVCHSLLKTIYNWAIDEHELALQNPAKFEFQFEDDPEKRIGVLTDSRLKTIWHGLTEKEADPIWLSRVLGCKLHFLTLQRPVEIIRAHAEDFDWGTNTWRPHPSRTKTNERYFVPLSPEALEIFRRLFELSGSVWAFPKRRGEGHAGESILRDRFVELRDELVEHGQLDSDDIDLYDGRRFGRTAIRKRLGFSKDVAEMVINHKQPRTISDIYEVEDNEDEVRAAQEAWAQELMRIVE